MQHLTPQQIKEQLHIHTSADEAINSAFSETLQTREQYKDSPIWIIEKGNKFIAVIAEYQILEADTRQKIEEALDKPTLKTYCIITSIIADKILSLNK